MLTLEVPNTDFWDEAHERFITSPSRTLHLEHSLFAMSKWEMHYERRYLTKRGMTSEEFEYYIWCMSLDDISLSDVKYLPVESLNEIGAYIARPMSARKMKKQQSQSSRPVATDDIYAWMIELGIPLECQYWHFNRLMMLINVCRKRAGTGKKPTKGELYRRYDEINNANRARWHSTG